MASQKSARRSRKRRASATTPRAVTSDRRERRAAGRDPLPPPAARERSTASTYGERPPGLFGGVPVSEIAILAGAIAVVIGWLENAPVILFTGVGVCALGTIEVTAREHFSGYRSHATLLAGLAAVAVETLLGVVIAPGAGALLLLAIVPVFGLTFLALRRRFTEARQARVRALPPA
jgi:hypothetical protein